MLFDEPAENLDSLDHQIEAAGPSHQLAGSRIAVPHPPGGFRLVQEDGSLCVGHDGPTGHLRHRIAPARLIQPAATVAPAKQFRQLIHGIPTADAQVTAEEPLTPGPLIPT